ncbi:MAG: transglycosylase domain-containing protein [Spirochaetes bacterium]|jgi:hypothetical protein|nr:transglycosylase domain-containing protein [Spirochaetota bacterium]
MKRLLIIILTPVLLLSLLFFVLFKTYTMLPDTNTLDNVARSCAGFEVNRVLIKSFAAAQKFSDKPLCYSIMKIFYRKNIFSDDSYILQYTLSRNLLLVATDERQPQHVSQIQIMFMIRHIGKQIKDDNQLTCLYLAALRHGSFTGAEISRYYFGKPVSELSLTETVRLAVLTVYPEETPYSNSEKFKVRAAQILKHLYRQNIISSSDYRLSLLDFR